MKFQNENQKISYINENGEELGYLKFTKLTDEKVLTADSTFVDPSLRGQGIAKQLVDHLVAYAKQEDFKIRPVCSYVVKLFEVDDSYQDIKE